MSSLTLGRVSVRGLDGLRVKLRALPPKVAREIIRPELARAAEEVARVARSETPTKTGRLRNSIGVVTAKGSRLRSSVVVGAGFFKGETFYGGFVHFGHGIGKRSSTIRSIQRIRNRSRRMAWLAQADPRRKVPANPFLKRAFELSRARVERQIVTNIAVGIERVASQQRSVA